MKSLLYCRDPGKAGQNFIPAKRDHVITPFEIFPINIFHWLLLPLLTDGKVNTRWLFSISRFFI